MPSLRYGSHTDVGRVRAVNEDACLAAPPVFAVADGMGGHHGGDRASRIAVEELARLRDTSHHARTGTEAITGALRDARSRIVEIGRGGPWHRYAGTTVAAALLVEDPGGPRWLLANLGDSRIYTFAAGRLDQVSVDHSLVQELLDSGTITPDEAAHHPERHVITRALGGPEAVEPDFFGLPVAAAPRLVLCSDGVNGMIGDAEMAAVLADAGDPSDAARRLVEAALEAGGRDNATAVVVDVVGLADDPPTQAAEHDTRLEEKLGDPP